MKKAVFFPAVLVLFPAVCHAQEPAPPFKAFTDVIQTMEWILEPAAEVIWGSAGTIITAQGSQELAPTSDEGWQEVVQAAALVAETGNLLMIPGRNAGPDWQGYAQDLVDAGATALSAAQARDSDALFDAGGQIYQVCLACHTQYMAGSRDN
ncbi:MAG: hypothetical protein V7709_07270 [Halioglobus sp.]